jgi:hypothetical protein
LHGNHCQKLLTKTRVVQANIRRDKFWDTWANFAHMVEPILMSLTRIHGVQSPWYPKFKTSRCGNFHESSLITYWRLIHTSSYLKEKTHCLNNNCSCSWT